LIQGERCSEDFQAKKKKKKKKLICISPTSVLPVRFGLPVVCLLRQLLNSWASLLRKPIVEKLPEEEAAAPIHPQ